ncbi:MAG TPA: carboxypeptidase-like regulatory domain-containing protein, partial [Candidatus Baltobacteraceae bacterium]|nr:carboxypeptidase-like regulatory domain-containing protein [Candidatus Baltobacteraceae bacterium]
MAIALFLQTAGTLVAGTTGTISGTITDQKTGAPLPNVTVSAVSPTGHYTSHTDAKGFFAFTGVSPDTYTVSFELTGHRPASLTGINVFADQVASVSTKLSTELQTIGSVTARAPGGAFQPTQTQDTYDVTSTQIATLLGKTDSISETNLITRLPGGSLDRYGYPVLRGGREYEEGFQFEGIDYVDAFTNQFTNSLALNPAVGQLQFTPGAGDASSGNVGTGAFNLVSKKGTYPAFGSLDVEALLNPFTHQLGFEYGFATPNGKFSNYFSFLGSNQANQYGEYGTPATNLSTGTAYSQIMTTSRDVVENMIFKFGRDNNQSL